MPIFFLCSGLGGPNVCAGGGGVRPLLASVPCILRVGLPPPGPGISTLRATHLPRLLLARDGQLHVQPTHLLLDE